MLSVKVTTVLDCAHPVAYNDVAHKRTWQCFNCLTVLLLILDLTINDLSKS